MRALAFAVLLATPALADRLAPFETQQAVLGCWDVKAGARLVVKPFGKHSIKFVATFASTPKGGPKTMQGDGTWVEPEYDVICRPRSQHGSFCRVSPAKDGLRVRVFAIRHDDPQQGRLVEDFVATKCAR